MSIFEYLIVLLFSSFLMQSTCNRVGYLSRFVNLKGRQIPLAIWLPIQESDDVITSTAIYPHQISIKRIVKMLLGFKALPNFAFFTKTFDLHDRDVISIESESQRQQLQIFNSSSIVLASHGYLGSRFDLAHICKSLAKEGMVVVAPELPESLSASYDTEWNSDETDKVTRDEINRATINMVKKEFIVDDGKENKVGIGVLGHSLGTGTAVNFDTGRSSPRCCIAGFRIPSLPPSSHSSFLIIASDNDSVCPRSLINEKVSEFKVRWNTQKIETLYYNKYNHISFLWRETNDAMLQFLSPLLPLAKSLKVPLLNFDTYSESLDSDECADEMIPVITDFFRRELIVRA